MVSHETRQNNCFWFCNSIWHENSLSLYWRTQLQNAKYIKVEKYDDKAGWGLAAEESDLKPTQVVNTYYLGNAKVSQGTQQILRDADRDSG